jgi:hypothetical protein
VIGHLFRNERKGDDHVMYGGGFAFAPFPQNCEHSFIKMFAL